jgi:hypothetical protein
MRIAHKNLIDDVTSGSIIASSADANFPITNIQDQRLTTKWKSTGGTDESAIITLNTFVEYPDSSAGAAYFQHFATATVDSWLSALTASNMSIYATTGSLVLKATTATIYNYFNFYRSQVWSTGQTLILKFPYDSDLQSVVYYNGTSLSTMTLVNDGINCFAAATMVKGSTYTIINTNFNYLTTTIASTKTIPIDYVYLGTGAYTSTLLDNSGNGNDGTILGAIATQDGLYFDGVNDYLRSSAVLTSIPGEQFFSFNFPEGHPQFGTLQILMQYRATAAIVGFLFLARVANSDTLYMGYSNGTTSATLAAAAFFTGYSALPIEVGLYVNWTTGAVAFFRNGIQFGATQTMTTPVKPLSGDYLYIGCGLGISYFLAGTMNKIKYYGRALSSSEVLHLYNDEPFISENDGLVADWTLNKNLGVNTIAVLGYNIKTATEVTIQANDSDAWVYPSINETLTVNPETILKFLSDKYYYKYWKFIFNQGAVEIGRLWLGDYLTIDPSSLLDFRVTKKRSDMVVHGKNRNKFASIGIGWRRFELSFPRSKEEMIYQLSEMFDEVGNHSSVIFANFDSIRDYALVEPCYASLSDDINFNHTERMGFEYSLILEEEK